MKKKLPKDHFDLTLTHPPIPLIREEREPREKDDFLTMTLLTNPSDKDSHKFKLEVPYFEDGSPEELLELKQHLDTIFKGQTSRMQSRRSRC